MVENNRAFQPRELSKESDEPTWVPFDEAFMQLSDRKRRAVLRVLHLHEEAVGYVALKRSAEDYLAYGSIAPSMMPQYLKDLVNLGLIERTTTRRYAITDSGRGFLAVYDHAREVLEEGFIKAIQRRQADFLPGFKDWSLLLEFFP